MGIATAESMPRPTLSLALSFPWLLAAAVLAGGAIGCATPGPLVSLTPAHGPIVWVAGRATVEKEQSGIRVAAAFEHQDGDTLALRVEVANDTPAPIELDPSDMSFNVCQTNQRETCSPAAYVINPEQVLADLARAKSRNDADQTNDQIFLGTIALLSVATDVAAIGTGHADHNTGRLTHDIANDMAHDEARHDSARASISSQQQLWADVALRRSTIPPGRGVGGRVFIPINTQARRVWLHVMVGGRTFSFPFTQTVSEISPV